MKRLINRVRAFYRTRNARERAMLWIFAWSGLVIWYSSLSDSQVEVSAKISDLGSKREVARLVIGQEGGILEELAKAQEFLDASKTVSTSQLQKFVEETAQAAGLPYELTQPTSAALDKTQVHSVRLNSHKSNIAQLAEFEKGLRSLSPYVSVQEAAFVGDGKGSINAAYTICSFEFLQETQKN